MQRNKKTSFSLIELLICLSIIMIFCSLWVARFFDYNRQILMHELDLLFVTFSYVQQRALASNQAQELIFDVKNNTYSYVSWVSKKPFLKKLPEAVKFGFFKGAKGPPSDPRLPITKAFTFDPSARPTVLLGTKACPEQSRRGEGPHVIFLPNGNISSGTLYLVDKQEKNMVSLTCSVSQVSYIRKYRYENNKWVIIQ